MDSTMQQVQHNRRASDRNPLNTRTVEASLRRTLHPALDKLVHRAVSRLQLEPATPPVRQQVVRNGVACPLFGTQEGLLWLLFGRTGAGVTVEHAEAFAEQNGINKAVSVDALYNWRRFHGVASPVEATAG